MNVACAGGEPLALTDCLNFGNPEKPEIGWELAQAIEGISRAADALGIPVVSGNVSLYNETGGALDPAHAGRRLRRARPRRDAHSRPLAARRPRASLLRGCRRRPRAASCGSTRTLLARTRRVRRRRSSSRCARPRRWSGREPADVRVSLRGCTACSSRRRRAVPWVDLVELGTVLMCGVFGVRAPERDVARLSYFGLYALQHRGQESAGIAVSARTAG